MNEKEARAQIEAVYKELSVKDPDFVKYMCPVCKGHGKQGSCFYCGGSGVARRRKRYSK